MIRLPGFVVLLMTVLSAQERRPCLGRVVDGDGRALAGAEVTCVWCAPYDPTFLADEVHATSDAAGTFRVDLGRDVVYSAWAIGPRRADGSRLVSPTVAAVAGGPVVTIAAKQAAGIRRARLQGLGAWNAARPAGLHIYRDHLDAQGLALPLGADAESITLPVLPATECAAVVENAQGRFIVAGSFDAGADEPSISLPPSVAQLMCVQRGGMPVAGARLTVRGELGQLRGEGLRFWSYDRIFAGDGVVTDEAGKARALLSGSRPGASENLAGPFFVSASVWAQGEDSAALLPWWAGPNDKVRADIAVNIELQPQREVVGCLMQGGRPVANVEVLCVIMGHYANGTQPMCMRGKTEGNGRFVLAGLPPRAEVDHLFVRGRDVAAVLSAGPLPFLCELPGPKLGASEIEPIDLAALRTLAVQVLDRQGGPATGAMVMVTTRRRNYSDLSDALLWHPVDAAGHAELFVAEGELMAAAMDGNDFVVLPPLTAASGKDRKALPMQLSPMPLVRVRCLDGDDKPVRGARVFGIGGEAPDPPEDAVAAFVAAVAEALDMQFAMRRVSGADGMLEFPSLGGRELKRTMTLKEGSRRSRVKLVPGGDVEVARF